MEKREKKKLMPRAFQILKASINGFMEHNVTKMSGSLAYYTVFSMAPLLVLVIALCGFFLGREAAENQIYGQLSTFLDKNTALQIQEVIKNANINGSSTTAIVIGAVTLLIGATTVFADIQDSINHIWGIKPKPKKGWLKMLQNRFLSFSVIISLSFILLVSLLITTFLDSFSDRLSVRYENVSIVFFYILNQVITLAVIWFIFAVIFKVLPDARIRWKDVLTGAFVTAILFILGKFAISFYIGRSGAGDAFGSARSLVILLLWTYYSAMILYFGAEFTKAYVIAYGSEIRPNTYAVTTKEVEIETGKASVQESDEKAKQVLKGL
ncbi:MULTISPECIES: YihY/virulence factor BrkB family protein [Olivibacter]|uniref:YihY/virulence factor BrkB family protein n=2 Tax=Sphingobacteriaceae TaxID=84566 RepID=A0ABV6HJV2_9SPHI|nr:MULTISPECIES: YihY/virulence factor BrkB family protein [Olivibacter]QEL00654.1 YihY/virulence factor BrkB family protein [Olivibacter sp. LS-1]